jgi:hypothetical protein
VILDDPFEDPPSLEIPVGSPPPTEEMLASTRIGADEDLVSYFFSFFISAREGPTTRLWALQDWHLENILHEIM